VLEVEDDEDGLLVVGSSEVLDTPADDADVELETVALDGGLLVLAAGVAVLAVDVDGGEVEVDCRMLESVVFVLDVEIVLVVDEVACDPVEAEELLLDKVEPLVLETLESEAVDVARAMVQTAATRATAC
jgi:hypothetical protein